MKEQDRQKDRLPELLKKNGPFLFTEEMSVK